MPACCRNDPARKSRHPHREKKSKWDGPNMRATNAPEAAQYISPTYRNGWSL